MCLNVQLHLGSGLEILQLGLFLSVLLSLEQVFIGPRKEMPEELTLGIYLKILVLLTFVFVLVQNTGKEVQLLNLNHMYQDCFKELFDAQLRTLTVFL